ncbi:MAG: hypothetical protein HN507_04320 [Flavobacteriaceae bacterium]|nr:hypothetical protein [Flavobacteriaceae bacterium]
MTATNKPKTAFWIIAISALIWNLMGVMAYLGQAYMTDETKALLPEAEKALYDNVPIWVTAAFAIAVFGGVLASIALLMRKQIAKTLFLVSLIGILVQMIYNFFISGAMDVYGHGEIIMSTMVIVIGVYLYLYSKNQL